MTLREKEDFLRKVTLVAWSGFVFMALVNTLYLDYRLTQIEVKTKGYVCKATE